MAKIVFLLFLFPLVACSYKSAVLIKEGEVISKKQASLHYEKGGFDLISVEEYGLFREYNYLVSSDSEEKIKNYLVIKDKEYKSLSEEEKNLYRRFENRDRVNYHMENYDVLKEELWVGKYPIFDAYSYCADQGGEVGSFSLASRYIFLLFLPLPLPFWKHERETFITCIP